MATFASDPQQRRNVAFIGHGGVGKTALQEAILHAAGVVTRLGSTTDGTSHFDFEPEEIKRGASLKTTVFDFAAPQNSFALIDTPGASSFLADTICGLRAADAAVLVVGAVSGLKVQGQKGWNAAVAEQLSRAVFVNELDKERASFERAIEAVVNAIGISPAIIHLPIGSESNLRGVVDVLAKQAYFYDGKNRSRAPVPEEMRQAVDEAYSVLIEKVAELDDTLLEKYLESGTLSEKDILNGLRRAFFAGQLVPLFCGSALTTVGADALLDAFTAYFPSPLERVPFRSAGDLQPFRPGDSDFAAIVFKTFADPFTGQTSLARIVSGCINSDETVTNINTGATERVGKLHRQRGKDYELIDSAAAGDIIAISKLKTTLTGHTLACSPNNAALEGFDFPETCIDFAIEPKKKGDEDKIVAAVEKMSHEDPAIRLKRDPSTHETLICGMGQDHVEIALQRIERKFKVEIQLFSPRVPYRETIRRQAEAQGRHKKQSGGRGQFGDCWLRISPLVRGGGFEFGNEVFGGAIPKNYIPAVEKGVIEAMFSGPLAGYPMIDISCTVYDGSYHAVDSNDMAFKLAAIKGFRAAVEFAEPVLLEPVMHARIAVPDDCTGEVIGDLNARRGRVLDMHLDNRLQVIDAEVPMAEMLTYAQQLRSLTADRGSFHLELHGYEEVPPQVAQQVVNAAGQLKQAANA